MKFIIYSDWKQLPQSSNELFLQAEKTSLFFSRPWFENLVATSLKSNPVIQIACVIENDNVLAILPLLKRNEDDWESLSTYSSSLFTLLLSNAKHQSTLLCLAQGLSKLSFKYLRLTPTDDSDRHVISLQAAMTSSGFSCHRVFRFYNWTHPLQGQTFDSYMAARPAKVRNTITRKKRTLERDHGFHILLFTDGDLQQAITDYNTVYLASWKPDEACGGFIEGAVKRFAQHGCLRLAVLYCDSQPIAAQIWFVMHTKANIFRLVYDKSWKQYSPGSILTEYLMKHVIDTDKVEKLDFLTGNEAYKQDWMSERKERWALDFTFIEKPKTRFNRLLESLKLFSNKTK